MMFTMCPPRWAIMPRKRWRQSMITACKCTCRRRDVFGLLHHEQTVCRVARVVHEHREALAELGFEGGDGHPCGRGVRHVCASRRRTRNRHERAGSRFFVLGVDQPDFVAVGSEACCDTETDASRAASDQRRAHSVKCTFNAARPPVVISPAKPPLSCRWTWQSMSSPGRTCRMNLAS